MDNPAPNSDTNLPGVSGFSPLVGASMHGDSMVGSDFVLGYPETKPASVHLGPMPSGVGAKPSGKPQGIKPVEPAIRKNPQPQRTGPPLPKRPKGRLFIGSFFLIGAVGLGYAIFNSMLRYSAYGEVIGRRIELAVPWPGIVQSIHVREGDRVELGDLIVRIDNLEMSQKVEEIEDALRLEQARLTSELAVLRWEAEKIRDTRKLSLSEFYDKWSQLLWEQSRLADLRTQVKRIEPIYQEGAASEERMESLQFQLAGQEKRVEQLTEAVRALKHRSDQWPIELSLDDRMQPTLTRIENLQAELQRTRDLIHLGEIRAPASGRIVRTHRFVGEFADPSTPVADLLVDGSTEFVLYLPQSDVQDYPIGTTVTLQINPSRSYVDCQVQRLAMETQKAPDWVSRHYRADESVLPVYLRVKDAQQVPSSLALGSEVRLPRSQDIGVLSRLRQWWRGDTQSATESAAQSADASNALRPKESLTPDPEVPGRDAVLLPAEQGCLGRDGRTAAWIRRP